MPTQATLIDFYLNEQAQTAVDRFSGLHSAGLLDGQERRYRDLLPLSLPGPGQQYAFEVDLDNCSGCKACVTACHNLNGLDANETWRSVGLVHQRSSGQFLPKYETRPIELFDPATFAETPACEIPGYAAPAAQSLQQHITTACHHCVDPGCLLGCPVQAYEKDPITGIVKHLDDQCIGCQYCILMCPYEVPQYNATLGIVRKCDLCSGRLAEGMAPACVQSCPTDAIRIVLVEQAEARSAHDGFVAVAGAPDSSVTHPTTRYRGGRGVGAEMQAGDHYNIQPAHAEFPLLFMLIFTQLSVGLFLLTVMGNVFFPGGSLSAVSLPLTLAGWGSGVLGLGLALLHLGRPQYAFRVFLGLGTSWLSRETVAGLGYFLLATLYTGLGLASLLPPALAGSFAVLPGWVGDAASLLLVGAGLLFVFCSVMVYRATPRPFWRGSQPAVRFAATLLLLGSAAALPVLVASKEFHGQLPLTSPGILLCGLLVVVTTAKLLYESAIFAHSRDEGLTSLKRTVLLMQGVLPEFTHSRFVLGVMGGVFLPIALLLARFSLTGSLFLSVFLFLTVLLAESLERYLFFRCAVAPKMPGIPHTSAALYWWLEGEKG
ncbi:MAG: dimethyl sulfoxide reductase anchor subunit [Chloroflexi bacterium]|nr:dimethyl sulfoxide reductase anchor subunit [Chloroflexota bacterium]